MDKSLTPFGIYWKNYTCHVKLKFAPKTWETLKIEHIGKHRVSKTGYIIFEVELHRNDSELDELNRKLTELKQSKATPK